MNDITPPKKRPVKKVAPKSAVKPAAKVAPAKVEASKKPAAPRKPAAKKDDTPAIPETMDISGLTVGDALSVPKKGRIKRIVTIIVTSTLLVLLALAALIFLWFQDQQKPVDPANTSDVRVVIEPGMTPEEIGAKLDEEGLIKSPFAFDWYLRLTRLGNRLQAGTYSLSQSMSLSEIVEHLQTGKTDTFRVTFLPGATVADNKKVLVKAGFSKEVVEAAFDKDHDHEILKSRSLTREVIEPLEGYIYGETYEFTTSATAEEILQRSFTEMETVIKENNLEQEYQKQGLTLYEGITLASIIQREVAGTVDMRLVAGVFHNRLFKKNMQLGSDVTYQYAADNTGQARDTNLDSPYNTRRYTGLPPGPIATPGEEALLAVARPTTTDYLYFLSGDDDKTYFGRTEAEHQRNIEEHWQKKCQII